MLRSSFFTDEKIRRLSFPARLLFMGLGGYADSSGRMEYRPAQIKAAIFPNDAEVDVEPAPSLPPLIDELEMEGLVKRYVVEGNTYLWIPNFSKHQNLRRAGQSKFPDPLGSVISLKAETAPDSIPAPDKSGQLPTSPAVSRVVPDAPTEVEGEVEGECEKEKEGRGEERKNSNTEENKRPPNDVAGVTENLSPAEYARVLLEELGMPFSANVQVVADAIKACVQGSVQH